MRKTTRAALAVSAVFSLAVGTLSVTAPVASAESSQCANLRTKHAAARAHSAHDLAIINSGLDYRTKTYRKTFAHRENDLDRMGAYQEQGKRLGCRRIQ